LLLLLGAVSGAAGIGASAPSAAAFCCWHRSFCFFLFLLRFPFPGVPLPCGAAAAETPVAAGWMRAFFLPFDLDLYARRRSLADSVVVAVSVMVCWACSCGFDR
jgi:hypothetical protein